MALIKCPECGRKISDTTKNCIHCGYELTPTGNETLATDQDASLQTIEPTKSSKKKFLLWLAISFGSIIVVCVVLFFAFGLGKYLKGTIAYSKGDYSAAVKYLSESEYTLNKNKLPNAKTALAKEYIAVEDWGNAFELLQGVKTDEADEMLPVVQYNLAKQSFQAEEWDSAIELLNGLQYEDSVALLENATRNKGMSENADFDFLTAVEESIYRRIELTESSNHTFSDLISAETSRLYRFINADFFDVTLQDLANTYIEGLKQQEAALKKKYSDFQIMWQEGMVKRFGAIVDLTKLYGLFKDDPAFVEEYYSGSVDEQQAYLIALKAVDADFNKQFTNRTWKIKNSYQITVSYTNKTKYVINSASLYVFYYDKNGTRISDSYFSISNLKKGQTVICDFYADSARKISRCDFYWEIDPIAN